MAGSNNSDLLRNANVRTCRLRVWDDFEGLGFNLEASNRPPHIIRLVESNSPAAAGGLKILDVVLAVNEQNVTNADYNQVRNAIRIARDSGGPIELRVMEQRFYQALKKKNQSLDALPTTTIETPAARPNEYRNFPRHQPRTCNIRASPTDASFGFEVVNGENDIGAYIQEVFPNTPASATLLRKSDRIIEIDDKFVDKDVSKSILEKLGKAKSKGAVKLYVVDTDTYKYYQANKIPLASKSKRKSQSEERLSTNPFPTNQRECKLHYLREEREREKTEEISMYLIQSTLNFYLLKNENRVDFSGSIFTLQSKRSNRRKMYCVFFSFLSFSKLL